MGERGWATLVFLSLSRLALGKVRVVCVGDSNTVGKRAVTGNDYPSVLGRLLGDGYEVYNMGLSGAAMGLSSDKPYVENDEYETAVELVGAADGAAIVLSVFGTNDAKLKNWGDVASEFESNYRDFVATFEALGATVAIGVMVPYLGDDGGYCDGEDDPKDHSYCEDQGSKRVRNSQL